jgi:hypothetical protein
VPAALEGEREFIERFVAEQAVQTNEVQRCWALLPCFLTIARETGAQAFDLVELGPSAGLNLVWDRYRYEYDAGWWGFGGAPLTLVGEELSPVPGALLEREIAIRHRAGIDLAPVDVTTEEGARLLEAFVWPDQEDRAARLRSAIAAVRADPPELLQGDYVDLLPELLAAREDGALTVVFEIASRGYLTDERRAELRELLDEAGRRAPLAWLRAGAAERELRGPRGEMHGYGLKLTMWPGGASRTLAHCDYHARWLEWDA